LSISTSHASDFELDSIDIKHVIVDTVCIEDSCLTNRVMHKSKESRIQGKFINKCHNCRKNGHIRPNSYVLKFHRPWIKQDALRKSEVEDSSLSKYVPPHMKHIKGKGNIVCKNANHIFAEKVKQYSNKRSLPTCHHCGITDHIRPKCPQLQAPKTKVQRKLPTKATSGTLPSAAIKLHGISRSLFLPIKVANQRRTNQDATRESHRSPTATMAEGLLSLKQGMLMRMIDMDKTCKPHPRVMQAWVNNNETIHPLRGEWTHLVKVKSHHA
jgi:hypothetical protein